ncbi:hypothetical protein N181_28060 [Sinorhizobium fredii USDA 205]|uniref:Uncharacterized protein n=1 Tax=Rhizobium fredii TaxID=380 RepID=A0A844A3L7_RHIFR|nr:hypothetical protein [Sinorhizobium fredii]KSV81675.1 hypothetical protein N181_28060 [Sinorhizobium fredii USDA 205]MQX06811.1 hypothetical protein [Sinorhizobium fredii]GEC35513.1 hypothetical protein EFR01_56840 [Sinorhizobium fredii]GLS08243.1 hypothetical protein GCM10007864_18720 [Sinorhizobium fredii]
MLATTRTVYGPNLLARLLDVRTLQEIDACAKAAWVLNGEGLIGDDEMEYLAAIIEHQRKAIRTNMPSQGTTANRDRTPRARHHHRRAAIPAEKRSASWTRRRALAKECVIPSSIAALFTVSKLAVLSVIARAMLEKGSSNMSLPEIAARAGVGCTTARYAIRDAMRLGLITVTENRVNSTWNRPNTIRIICGRWLKWIAGHLHLKPQNKRGCVGRSAALKTPLTNLSPTLKMNIINAPEKPGKAGGIGARPALLPQEQRRSFNDWLGQSGVFQKVGVVIRQIVDVFVWHHCPSSCLMNGAIPHYFSRTCNVQICTYASDFGGRKARAETPEFHNRTYAIRLLIL